MTTVTKRITALGGVAVKASDGTQTWLNLHQNTNLDPALLARDFTPYWKANTPDKIMFAHTGLVGENGGLEVLHYAVAIADAFKVAACAVGAKQAAITSIAHRAGLNSCSNTRKPVP